MPTANEVIANRPLSGSEVKRLMLEDFERNLANDAYLADHIAYGRLSWQITHVLHFDNPNLTGSESFIKSRPAGRKRRSLHLAFKQTSHIYFFTA